jgi:hypothetical protein
MRTALDRREPKQTSKRSVTQAGANVADAGLASIAMLPSFLGVDLRTRVPPAGLARIGESFTRRHIRYSR